MRDIPIVLVFLTFGVGLVVSTNKGFEDFWSEIQDEKMDGTSVEMLPDDDSSQTNQRMIQQEQAVMGCAECLKIKKYCMGKLFSSTSNL